MFDSLLVKSEETRQSGLQITLLLVLLLFHKPINSVPRRQEHRTSLKDPSITLPLRAAFLKTSARIYAQLESSGIEGRKKRSWTCKLRKTADETLMHQRAGGDSRAAKDGISKEPTCFNRLLNSRGLLTFPRALSKNGIWQFVFVDVELGLHANKLDLSINQASHCAALNMVII